MAADAGLRPHGEIDQVYLRHVVERLSSIGSSPLGFRATGTPEDRAVADFVAAEMRDIGPRRGRDRAGAGRRLAPARCARRGRGRRRVPVRVDGRRAADGARGVLAPLVDVGTGERRRLDRLDVAGRIALLDWRSARSPSHRDRARARPARRARHDPQLPRGRAVLPVGASARLVRLALVRGRAAVRDDVQGGRRGAPRGTGRGRSRCASTLDADLGSAAPGYNVVGYLPGERRRRADRGRRPSRRLVQRRLRQRTGVAAMLGLARALATRVTAAPHALLHLAHGRGVRPTDSAYGWCTGAWAQISETHPEWAAGSPVPPQSRGQRPPGAPPADRDAAGADAAGRGGWRARAPAEGWLTSGWYTHGPPVTGTEAWPFLISGVPGVSAYTWERSFMRTDYHTQYDTADIVDFAHLERALPPLRSAPAERRRRSRRHPRPRGARGAGARGARAQARAAGAELAEAAERARVPCAAATRSRAIGRGLCAVDAHGTTTYPHTQAARDVERLEAALAALAGTIGAGHPPARARGRRSARADALRGGLRHRRASGRERDHPRASWGAQQPSDGQPDLWRELASLRGEPGARAPGPWIERSLAAAPRGFARRPRTAGSPPCARRSRTPLRRAAGR